MSVPALVARYTHALIAGQCARRRAFGNSSSPTSAITYYKEEAFMTLRGLIIGIAVCFSATVFTSASWSQSQPHRKGASSTDSVTSIPDDTYGYSPPIDFSRRSEKSHRAPQFRGRAPGDWPHPRRTQYEIKRRNFWSEARDGCLPRDCLPRCFTRHGTKSRHWAFADLRVTHDG